MQGTVFNIQRFSVDDGPGIRTTVFFKGCPLSCLWCHNPESAEARTEYFYHPEKCILCGGCMAVCQKGCHSFREDEKGAHHIFDRSSCVRCGACAGACPTKAIASVGKMMEAEEVIKEVLSDKIFYESSGGGMTISGGEPLAQPLFAFEVLRLAKAEGLHTAIETSGYASRETLDKILPYTDLFLFDYKARPEDYPRLTGVSADRILENLHYLSERGAHIVLRCPIIPDCNDTAEHYDGIASLGAKIAGIEEITLEPYHPLGISKSEQLGKTPRYDNRKFLEGKTLTETAADIAAKSGKPCRIS